LWTARRAGRGHRRKDADRRLWEGLHIRGQWQGPNTNRHRHHRHQHGIIIIIIIVIILIIIISKWTRSVCGFLLK
jgi:hypothetical protein